MSKLRRTDAQTEILKTAPFYQAVTVERRLQDEMWGPPEHAAHSWTTWMAILQREVGEALNEACALHFGRKEDDETGGYYPKATTDLNGLLKLRLELVQVAAVARAITEIVDWRVNALEFIGMLEHTS